MAGCPFPYDSKVPEVHGDNCKIKMEKLLEIVSDHVLVKKLTAYLNNVSDVSDLWCPRSRTRGT